MALLAGGGYAERVVVHQDVLLPIPERLSFEQAAAVPEAFLTASEALLVEAELHAGQTLLVDVRDNPAGLRLSLVGPGGVTLPVGVPVTLPVSGTYAVEAAGITPDGVGAAGTFRVWVQQVPEPIPGPADGTGTEYWLAFPQHTTYLVVEADDIADLQRFLRPGAAVTTCEITPVSDRPAPVPAE